MNRKSIQKSAILVASLAGLTLAGCSGSVVPPAQQSASGRTVGSGDVMGTALFAPVPAKDQSATASRGSETTAVADISH